jgi:hypothetical protein
VRLTTAGVTVRQHEWLSRSILQPAIWAFDALPGQTNKGIAASIRRNKFSQMRLSMKRDVADVRIATINESFSCKATSLLGTGSLGSPRWIGGYADDWEIVVYERETFWEACFFKGQVHHEHLKSVSMECALHDAERRIDSLRMSCSCSACDGVQSEVSEVKARSITPTTTPINSGARADSAKSRSEPDKAYY